VGDKVSVDLFAAGDTISVSGTSRASASRASSSGTTSARRRHPRLDVPPGPGSIGASAWPSRTLKGNEGGRAHGAEKVTVRNVEVVRVDAATTC